jgi:ABC-type phosphate/phosphonate transport system ATPase subunit
MASIENVLADFGQIILQQRSSIINLIGDINKARTYIDKALEMSEKTIYFLRQRS